MTRRRRDDEAVDGVLSGEGLTHEQVDAAIFGESLPAIPRGERTHMVSLRELWFDVTQPRKVVPVQVALNWDGNPEGTGRLFDRWSTAVKRDLKRDWRLKLRGILAGHDFIDVDRDKDVPPVVAGYLSLVDLALNIRDNGLNIPVTYSRMPDGKLLLHTGGRRTMAFHMLALHLDFEQYSAIPALERPYSAFTQAAENNQRETMNAISQARAVAKMLMEMHAGEIDLLPYEQLVGDDGCDRSYFAQMTGVSAKHGRLEEIMSALNTSNRARVSHYRKLLELSDEAWMLADERNLSERYLRSVVRVPVEQQAEAIRKGWSAEKIDEMFTTVNISSSDPDNVSGNQDKGRAVNTAGDRRDFDSPYQDPKDPAVAQKWMSRMYGPDNGLSLDDPGYHPVQGTSLERKWAALDAEEGHGGVRETRPIADDVAAIVPDVADDEADREYMPVRGRGPLAPTGKPVAPAAPKAPEPPYVQGDMGAVLMALRRYMNERQAEQVNWFLSLNATRARQIIETQGVQPFADQLTGVQNVFTDTISAFYAQMTEQMQAIIDEHIGE
jgi:hypothetical protein